MDVEPINIFYCTHLFLCQLVKSEEQWKLLEHAVLHWLLLTWYARRPPTHKIPVDAPLLLGHVPPFRAILSAMNDPSAVGIRSVSVMERFV